MFRALFAGVLIALIPLTALAEEQRVEIKAEKYGQVVAVSINMKSGEVKISISDKEKGDKEEKQESVSDKKHSRRRGK